MQSSAFALSPWPTNPPISLLANERRSSSSTICTERTRGLPVGWKLLLVFESISSVAVSVSDAELVVVGGRSVNSEGDSTEACGEEDEADLVNGDCESREEAGSLETPFEDSGAKSRDLADEGPFEDSGTKSRDLAEVVPEVPGMDAPENDGELGEGVASGSGNPVTRPLFESGMVEPRRSVCVVPEAAGDMISSSVLNGTNEVPPGKDKDNEAALEAGIIESFVCTGSR